MAEITRQRQQQAELQMQQQPIQEQKKARQAGMPMPDMQLVQQMPAEILAKLNALPIQIPKNMYEGEALTNHQELVTDQFRELSNSTALVDRKLEFREFHAEQQSQSA